MAKPYGCGTVRRDALTLVTGKILTVLKRHTSRPQATTERVLEVMYSNISETFRCSLCVALRPSLSGAFAG